jgi:hypothetical protein
MHIGHHVNFSLFSQILIKIVFCRRIFEKPHLPNFMKLPPVGAEIFRAVRQPHIEMMKLIIALRKFAKAPKNSSVIACEMSVYSVTDYFIQGRGSHSHRNVGNRYSVTKDLRLYIYVTST